MANGNRSVLVVGLGRFGSAVATTLDHMGQDVLAVDRNAELVSRWSSILPTVQADLTDVMAVEQIGITDFTTAVVAIGDSVEASVLVTSNLLDAGISDIWAKKPTPANASDTSSPATTWTTSRSTARTRSSRSTPRTT